MESGRTSARDREFALDERGEHLLVIASTRGIFRASDRRALMHRLADGRFSVLDAHGTSCVQVLDGKSLEFLHEIPLR